MNPMSWLKDASHMSMINRALVILLGVIAIIVGITGTYAAVADTEYGDISYVTYMVFVVTGIVLLRSTHKTHIFIIFVAGVTYGAVDLVTNIPSLVEDFDGLTFMKMFADLTIVFSSIHCMLGDRHCSIRVFVLCSIDLMMLLAMAVILVFLNTEEKGLDPTVPCVVASIAYIIVFMTFLIRPGVRDDFTKRRLKKGMVVVESIMSTTPNAFILRKDVDAVVGKDMSSWQTYDDGPIEKEHVSIVYDGPREFIFTSTKWRDEDRIRISIRQNLKSQYFGRGFMLVGSSIEECDGKEYLRIYGDGGIFIRLLISEGTVRKKRFFHREDVDEIGDILTDTEELILPQ
ncbi:hypothetical protein AUP07_0605 [methanogenic archaeon mixed culture ISO4-G1]|nr:hypothetical protein AUP07_0605 [methanogenic archaeon mixed culture ISO4-G1]